MPYEARSGFEHLEVEHAVHADLHVVAGDADLRRDVDGDFLERVAVADAVDERHQDVEAGVQRAAVAAEPLDDVGALLRHDNRRLGDDDEDEQGEDRPTISRPHRPSAGSFWLDQEHQLFDASRRGSAAPRASGRGGAVAGRPDGAAQLGATDGARRGMSSSGTAMSPTSESTSRRRRVELQPPQQRVAEQQQRPDRQHGEQHQLHPERPGQVERAAEPRSAIAATPKKMM